MGTISPTRSPSHIFPNSSTVVSARPNCETNGLEVTVQSLHSTGNFSSKPRVTTVWANPFAHKSVYSSAYLRVSTNTVRRQHELPLGTQVCGSTGSLTAVRASVETWSRRQHRGNQHELLLGTQACGSTASLTTVRASAETWRRRQHSVIQVSRWRSRPLPHHPRASPVCVSTESRTCTRKLGGSCLACIIIIKHKNNSTDHSNR